MEKCIAVFGAGTGLGAAVARQFGKQGYRVALVARRKQPLEALVAELKTDGITAAAFPGDLSQPSNVAPITAAIREKFGHIDAVYYAPISVEAFLPAFALTPDIMTSKLNLFFVSLLAVVGEVLPEMRRRRAGMFLVGLGGTAAIGIPFLSGPGPAMAAARNYLYSLHGELASENIYVGMLTITAIIQHSASHKSLKSGELQLPAGMEMPQADPAELARQFWTAATQRGEPELVFPPRKG